MRLRHWLLAGSALLLLMAAGCVPAPAPSAVSLPPRPTAVDETAALIRLGQDALGQGRNLEAGDAFRAALRGNPGFDQAAQARLGLAKALAAQGQREQAQQVLGQLAAQGAPGAVRVDAGLLAARLERDQGKLVEATNRLRTLLITPPAPLSVDQRRQAVQMLAELLEAQEQYAAAAANLVRLSADSPAFEQAAIARRLVEVAGKAPSAEVEPLMASPAAPQVRAALMLGLAKSRLREGKLEQAEQTVREFKQMPESQPLWPLMQSLDREREAAESVQPRAVGVILPLSGNYAAHGRRVLASIELGLGLFSDGDRALTLYIEDGEGDARRTAEAVTRLAKERQVIAIIGPLDAATSLAAARAAQENKVPLMVLSPQEGVTQAGDYVFQNFFTPADQVEALLSEVMDRRGQTRLAVLAPRTPYGQGFVKLFDAGVLARGGSVVRTLWYQTSQSDFTNDVKQLVHLPPGSYRTGRPDSPKPVIDFQALFVPDGSERAALIAPQLLYHDITGISVLGTSLWHNPKLLGQAGRYLGGSVIPDAFDPAAAAPLTTAFVRDFREALGQEPNVIDAHGYDSALILRSLLQGPEPPRTRTSLRVALSGIKDLIGLTGQLTMGSDRRVHRPLQLFTVQGEAFVRINPESSGPNLLGGEIQGLAPAGEAPARFQPAASPGGALTPMGASPVLPVVPAPAGAPVAPENLPPAPAGTIAR
ncbi:MAG: penicillin-binding protein activator [Pseudomonadota bacterium]